MSEDLRSANDPKYSERNDLTRTTQIGPLQWKSPTQRLLTAATREGRLPPKCPSELEPIIQYLHFLGVPEGSKLKDELRMPYEQHATLQYAMLFPPRVRSLLLGSIRAAMLGRLLSGTLVMDQVDPSCSYICGLFHQIGSLALDSACYPHELDKIDAVRSLIEGGMADHEAEQEVFGTDQAFIGAELMQKWGAPEWFSDCLRYQDNPTRKPNPYVCMTHLCSRLSNNLTHEDPASTVDPVAYQILGITKDAITSFVRVYEGFIPLVNLARDIEAGRTNVPSPQE